MKENVVIINTSRGPLISRDDLFVALKNKRIRGAALDVIEREPITDLEDEILKLDNLILTPHAAYNSFEASIALHQRVAETACKVLRGETVSNIVNKEVQKVFNN
jgi:D-3-phosphoglycerate dehydrogenase